MHRATLLIVVTASACSAQPKAAGERCKDNVDCATGLVCVADACVDAVKITKERAEKLKTTIEQYMQTHKGDCPGEADRPKGMTAQDAWGRPFEIACPGTAKIVDVVSLGPDGVAGSGDEVTN